jgi:hypothetical protein
MRLRDRQEIYATRWSDNPADLAHEVTLAGIYRWGFYVRGRPVAMIGATPRWPRVWNVWAFGTDEWPVAVPAMTRHIKRFMIPGILGTGALRADCMVLATHEDSKRWLKFIGFRPEKLLANWGKNGEAFWIYSRTRSEAEG